jgi:hypothetical protein
MRQTAGFLVVMATVGFVVWSGVAIFRQHKDRYEGQACGGIDDVKCPGGYECVNKKGTMVSFGESEAGTCRFLIRW